MALAAVAATWRALRPREVARPRFTDLGAPEASAEHAAAPCAGCHPAETAAWTTSQHREATRAFAASDGPVPHAPRTPVGVLGVAPLRQMLVPSPGGRVQVLDPAWDPARREWFSIFGDERPNRGEWGHWEGRGMTWNAQCAGCHMTELAKGWDRATDTYRTSWTAVGISCAACHDLAPNHGRAPAASEVAQRARANDLCVGCHSRREDLTDRFRPGEAYDEHHRLFFAEGPDLFFPDGQAKDEVFEGGSLALSRMGQAGIVCLDCHEPHGGKLRAAWESDALCLTCHAPPGRRGAIPIDAAAHRHHPEGVGGRCVDCHMPTHTFMQSDARRDHGFTSPDPALAAALGAEDACTSCHRDKSPPWAAEQVEAWFGATSRRPAHARARAVALARTSPPSSAQATDALLATLAREANVAWRASLCELLGPRVSDARVRDALFAALADRSPRVRAAAARGLGRSPAARERLVALRDDPSRLVRLAAIWSTRDALAGADRARSELEAWLAVSADQPAGAMRLAELAIVDGRTAEAVAWAERAVAWDPSAPSFHTLARALHAAGRDDEARAALRRAEAALRPDARPP